MKTYKSVYLAVSLSILMFGNTSVWCQTAIEAQVDNILKSGLENAEKFQAIKKLGSDAVPVLLTRLRWRRGLTTSTLIEALGEIGDEQAVPDLVQFIKEGVITRSDGGISYYVNLAIKALKNIEGDGGLEALYDIMVDETVPMDIKLECAGAVSRKDHQEKALVARKLIIDIYQSQYRRGVGEHEVDTTELAEALYEVQTEESRSILAYILKVGQTYEQGRIIQMYKRNPDPEMEKELFKFSCLNEGSEPYLQLQSLLALSKSLKSFPQKKLSSCFAAIKNHLSPEFRIHAEMLEAAIEVED